MDSVQTPTTYRVEEQDLQGRVLGTWGRQSVDRDDALGVFVHLAAHPMYRPHTGRRLVMLADPVDGAPLNAEAEEDLAAAGVIR